jgi:hypothetical protein
VVANSEYQWSAQLDSMIDNFVNKYEKLATDSRTGKPGVYKVPGKEIYVASEGNVTITSSELPGATLIVLNGDVIIEGDVK